MKTAKIRLDSIKDPDGWWELITALGLHTDEKESFRKQYFKWGEYASLELEIDESLNVVGGRILRLEE